MSKFVEFQCIDDSRISLDLDIIRGYSEEKNVRYTDEQGKTHSVPDHTVLITSSNNYRIKSKYDEIKVLLEEEQWKDNIGL